MVSGSVDALLQCGGGRRGARGSGVGGDSRDLPCGGVLVDGGASTCSCAGDCSIGKMRPVLEVAGAGPARLCLAHVFDEPGEDGSDQEADASGDGRLLLTWSLMQGLYFQRSR